MIWDSGHLITQFVSIQLSISKYATLNLSRDKLCPPLPPRIVVTKTAQWGECKNGVQNATYTIKVR